LDYWSHRSGAVWSINPPGYGQSTGPAWIERFPTAAQATWLHLKHLYPKAKIIVTGNSLGTAIALFIAARFQPDGLLLRNPPPIRQLICQRPRYNWWNLGAAKYIARQFPQELDSIENAKSCRCPALFVQSGQDSLVPIEFQNRIIHAYSGKQKTLVLGNANHDTPVLPEQETDYRDALTWLEQQALTRID
jgi:pimeloyl-ACP methyl ester carboxylesterase